MQAKDDRSALRRGDLIGVVAPGFAVRAPALRSGVARLHEMGYRTRLGDNVLARNGYLAGSDDQRLDDLRIMIDDPEIRAIWFARGGYGSARLLQRVPWRRLARRPRLLIGYSDLTALFGAAVQRSGARCLYGPVVTELGNPDSYHAPSLRTLLAGRELELRFRRRDVLVPGTASGPVAGGNLSVLAHLCGTRFFPDLRGRILFLEEIGEEVYRIDRMLTQLRQAGRLEGVAGVLLGAILAPPRKRFPASRPLQEVLDEAFRPLGVPVIAGLPLGHVRHKRTLPLGTRATLNTRARRIRFQA